MKKIFQSLAFSLAIAGAGTASAQNAHESSVKFDKNNENAIVADYNKPADIVEAALKKQFESEGLSKSKSKSGYTYFSKVTWNKVGSQSADIYYKVEGKKEKSTVTVLVSKGYNNFISSGSDASAVDNVKAFLNDLSRHADVHQHTLIIKAQEEAVAKAEKAFSNSADNNKDLMAQKEKLEKKIAESTNEQTLKQQALDAEKKKLTDLKASAN